MTRRRIFNLLEGTAKFEQVRNADTQKPELYLYDEISYFGVTAGDFVAQLQDLGDADFDLHVNSPGGDVFDGIAILNSLRAYKGKVTAIVDGIAASAASFILMGADEVVMSRNSELMIHDAFGVTLGNAADHRYMADRLDKVSDNIANVYFDKAGGSIEDWRKAMLDETWYSASDAVDVGLADRVGDVTDSAASNKYDLSHLKNHKTTTQPEGAIQVPLPDLDFSAMLRRAFEEAKA